jgi:phosphoenolpyruvate---glycerone phosphotransferase subunit DhaL
MNPRRAEAKLELYEPMLLDAENLLDVMAQAVIANAAELTELDSAIGDADHGLNMKRGFEAVLADRVNILAKPLPEAIAAMGYTLVMKIGGASGPLYGTLFMALGKELGANPSLADLGRALLVAGAAVGTRGKAETGSKTLLDVLLPVSAHIASGTATIKSVRQLAAASAKATIAMKALRGRASFLGDRSIGHMDPGARSCEILIDAVCDVLEGAQ